MNLGFKFKDHFDLILKLYIEDHIELIRLLSKSYTLLDVPYKVDNLKSALEDFKLNNGSREGNKDLYHCCTNLRRVHPEHNPMLEIHSIYAYYYNENFIGFSFYSAIIPQLTSDLIRLIQSDEGASEDAIDEFGVLIRINRKLKVGQVLDQDLFLEQLAEQRRLLKIKFRKEVINLIFKEMFQMANNVQVEELFLTNAEQKYALERIEEVLLSFSIL